MTKWRGRDEHENTEEMLRVIDHLQPRSGHPTGRILQGREGYEIDCLPSLNTWRNTTKRADSRPWNSTSPYRLDLDWRLCKHARLGVPVAINPDAHSVRGLSDIAYGVMTARKGWIEPHDTLNAMTGAELTQRLGR